MRILIQKVSDGFKFWKKQREKKYRESLQLTDEIKEAY